MSEIKDVDKYAGWYASYMTDDQGKCLIECMKEKIISQDNLLVAIIAEIELAEEPREASPEIILQSIKDLIGNQKTISHKIGYFEWFSDPIK